MTRFLCRLIPLLALGVLVGGCITTAEQQAERANQRCVARGYSPGTKDFDECLTLIETERGIRQENNRRMMIERSAAPSMNRGQ